MNVIWDMTIGEIGQIAGLSVAVVVSLILGVMALRQTKRLQDNQFEHEDEIRKRELKQKRLDEIIEWAREVLECGTSVRRTAQLKDILDMAKSKSRYLLFRLAEVADLQNNFVYVMHRSPYVLKVAEGIENDDVYNAVELVRKFLIAHDDTLDELRKVLSKKPEEYDETEHDKANENTMILVSNVRASAQSLIAKVTDAKIKLDS
jgi:hypothetical protein